MASALAYLPIGFAATGGAAYLLRNDKPGTNKSRADALIRYRSKKTAFVPLPRKRKFVYTDLSNKRQAILAPSISRFSKKLPMSKFKSKRRTKRSRRSRGKRRSRKSRGRKRRSLRRPETCKVVLRTVNQNLNATDPMAPAIYMLAPFTYGPTQGVQENQFWHNIIETVGIRMRIQFRRPAALQRDIHIRAWLCSSRANSPANGIILNDSTTDTANPACTGNQTNIRMFDSTISAWSPFVGDDITTPFDMSNVRIHKMYQHHHRLEYRDTE